jgi:hypothetical protein
MEYVELLVTDSSQPCHYIDFPESARIRGIRAVDMSPVRTASGGDAYPRRSR